MATYKRIEYEQLASSPLAKLTGRFFQQAWDNCVNICTYKQCIDIASSALGSSIVAVTDEFFAPAINMINPAPPIHAPGKFVGKYRQRKTKCV